jgi:DNA-directed RNA polymerase specialized sigma24 family protein
MQRAEQKKDWNLSPAAFRRLLEWLDEDADSGGRKYLEMRERLITYFDRKNCLLPDELADETLNRVARRLEEEGKIETETPAKYCYITARFVFLESLRGKEKQNVPLDKSLNQKAVAETDEKEEKEKMLVCLENCTGKLDAANREIILDYYVGEERTKIENRRAIAARLEISVNALSIRACRIRDKLETCVKKCAEKK